MQTYSEVESPFVFEGAVLKARARPVLRRLPCLVGQPIRIHQHPGLRDRHGPVHAGAFLRERRIAFDCRGGSQLSRRGGIHGAIGARRGLSKDRRH